MASDLRPLEINQPRPDEPSPSQIARAAAVLDASQRPIILAGHGAARGGAAAPLRRFSELLGLLWPRPFTARASFPTTIPTPWGPSLYEPRLVNFGFDDADVIVSVGYELQEFDPIRINPGGDKQIIHLSRFPAEVDAHYVVQVGIQADIGSTLAAIRETTTRRFDQGARGEKIRRLLAEELALGAADDSFPLKPQRLVADTRAALGRSDVVLADTGAVKMWMACLYPTYEPNTCLISNGLSTMASRCPGPSAPTGHARPQSRGRGRRRCVLDELPRIETALREQIPLVIVIWEDGAYGLIGWKMDLELGHHVEVGFSNPDFVTYAESFGARGYRVGAASDLLPMLNEALAADTVSVITCPVDYTENLRLTAALGELSGPF